MASTGVLNTARTPSTMSINAPHNTRKRFLRLHSMMRVIMVCLGSRLHFRSAIKHLLAKPRVMHLGLELNPVRTIRRAGERVFRHRAAEHFHVGEFLVRTPQRLSERHTR